TKPIRFSFVLTACSGVARPLRATSSDETVQSTSMSGKISFALLASASCLCFAGEAAAFEAASPGQPVVMYQPAVRMPPAERSNMGGGLIEFLFGDAPQGGRYQQAPAYQPQPDYGRRSLLPPMDPQQSMYYRREGMVDPAQRPFDPQYEKQVVEYHGKEIPGTIVIDTPNKFLFLVQGDGKALRYGVGVGRPGFTWAGVKTISAKKEWPAWT